MQMSGSPIDDRVWRYAMHGAAAIIGLQFARSLYQQHVATRRPTQTVIQTLEKATSANDDEGQVSALRSLLSVLEDEAKSKRGGCKTTIQSSFKTIVTCTLTNPKNTSVITSALQVISRCCQDDVECKAAFVRANGVRRLIALLQSAHESANTRLMEDIAATLKDVTLIPEQDVVLGTDVPRSATAVECLLRMASLPSMLRTLDPHGRVGFLQSMTGVFANICTLGKGCAVISKGLDGKPGARYFVALIDHVNPQVSENAIRTLKFLALHEQAKCDDILTESDVVGKLIDAVDVRRDARTIGPILTIFKIMIMDAAAAKRDAFLREFILRDGLDALFTMWCTGSDKLCRDRSEVLVHALEEDGTWSGAVLKLREVYRSLIQKRKDQDIKEQKQRMQAMQQQKMFQQMMMEQMMGGGGGMGPGGDGEDDYE